jgi:microcystin-dependent protein
MARNAAPNGKLTNNQRSAVRVMLATGATLMTLISAQMFASANTVSAASAAVTTTTTQNTTTSSVSSDDGSSILLTSNQAGTVYYYNQTQPVPSSHSSR